MATAITNKHFIQSSIGKKYVMGLTGLIWAGFVFAHMAGNMLIFIGADAYNKYGHGLTSGNLIYLIETVLVLSLLTHIACAVSLIRENRAARGDQRYAMIPNGVKGASVASRTMAFQGSLILFFIISHLLTFKFGTYYQVPNTDMRDLHRLMTEVFKQPAYIGWYVVSLVALLFHLNHGIGSIFQSLGLRTDKYAPLIKKMSWGYSIVVFLGFLSQPLYVFFNN